MLHTGEISESGTIITAPIIFVGTHKDAVPNFADHESVSTILFDQFKSHPAWSNVVENERGRDSRGTATLTFFAVDNKMGRNDSTVVDLMRVAEDVIKNSDYIHERKPLSYFKVIDEINQMKESYLSIDNVYTISDRYGLKGQSVTDMLQYFHDIGLLLWHDEEGLRHTVIREPVEFFVTPAAKVICKHAPTDDDPMYHLLAVHKKCEMEFGQDFVEMRDKGIISERLLRGMLEEHLGQYDQIKLLMIKYGLLVPLVTGADDDSATVHTSDYVIPALLPIEDLSKQTGLERFVHRFYFYFYIPVDRKVDASIRYPNDMHDKGFLPVGLFERLVGKASVGRWIHR